jgi:CRISPR-associated endonuclease/helicase Cas3
MTEANGSSRSAPSSFEAAFQALTGNEPFPWQVNLFKRFATASIPSSCSLPTGLGKTSVIAVWLIALAREAKVPRRLVYVVNRRTVVDQTTAEVEKLRCNLPKLGAPFDTLALAISTLRGQFADNREWSADPSRPAVICGTVDMIGSRLLFSGYGVGFRSRPLHAGFLGQDALLIHDEAHLEPPFQKLIARIAHEQADGERTSDLHWPKMQVMQLTATMRKENEGNGAAFTLTQADREHSIVRQRLEAHKGLVLTPSKDDGKVSDQLAEIAESHKDHGVAVLVLVRTLEAVAFIEKRLLKTGRPVLLLTGTLRGKERDELVKKPEFRRFLERGQQGETVYLVCTAAGEVGVNLSADHMVCDLSTFESMVQRLGRVNRYGDRTDTRLHVVHPRTFGKRDKKTGELKADEIDKRRQKTLQLLRRLRHHMPQDENGHVVYDASPQALMELPQQTDLPCEIEDAFSPEPVVPPATDILFDAWALTSIRDAMPARPPVEPYLHGIAEWQPPETHVAWRKEVELITGNLLERHPPADLLDDYPLKPHELLRDRSDRVLKQLKTLAERHADRPVWLRDARGAVEVTTTTQLANKEPKNRIHGCTVLLPPSVGGLSGGMLDGKSPTADDVADIPPPVAGARVRVWSDDPNYDAKTSGMRRVRSIVAGDAENGGETEPRRWEWFERVPLEGGRTAVKPVAYDTHVGDVVAKARSIVASLSLPEEIAGAVALTAELHDLGKKRQAFQTALGNTAYPEQVWAKSGRRGAWLPEAFRHEFASMLDAQDHPKFQGLSDEMKDLVLHLIAAHHGRARPHFPPDEAFDPDRLPAEAEALAIETPRRFARLQRKYGRWGLAYLESLLRAADWAASAAPSAFADQQEAHP